MIINRLVSLKQLHANYGETVWDTCSLSGYLPFGQRNAIDDESRFAEFFIDKIPKYNCFIPGSVERESINGRCLNWKNNTKKGKLIKKFEENNKVLYLDSFLGSSVIDRYVSLSKGRIQKKHKIHPTDLRVFSWALELRDFFESPVAIVSNDMKGMKNFWKDFIYNEGLNSRELGFFPRRDLDWYGGF